MRIELIKVGKNPPTDINVIIEVPVGGEPVKYEMDKESCTIKVDRILQTEMRYPGNYGFIPHTLSDDGDPVDVLIANRRPIIPGAVMSCRPLGILYMTDEAGGDEKILAVPSSHVTPIYDKIRSYKDLPENIVLRIAHFFEHYKDLEDNKWVKIKGWGDADEAGEYIMKSIQKSAPR